ncbi:MFS transporter [Blastococcus sp. SYSU D00820]
MTAVGRTGGALLVVAVLLAGLNQRGAIAAVSPVLPEVRADLGLSAPVAGLLTTLPVLCFAVLAPPAAWLGRRLGLERGVLAGLALLTAGTALRVLDGTPVLVAGTVAVGAGMTIGNVLIPAVVKRDLPGRAGTVTGLYTAALAAGAAAMAALTAPLAGAAGWRAALAGWALLALVAVAAWTAVGRSGRADPPPPVAPGRRGGAPLWRQPVAWAVSGVLALHSVLYYTVTAWLPTIAVEELGMGLERAALATSVFHVLGIAGTLVVPLVAGRAPGQRALGVAVGAAWALLPAGLLLAPGAWPVWVTAGGLAQGMGISLAFTLIVLRAADGAAAVRLSGMAQLIGYSVAAAGPPVAGLLSTATGGWTVPLVLLVALAALLGAAGLVGGRPVGLGGAAPAPAEVSRPAA